MYAHYFKAGSKHFLIISETNRPIGTKLEFASKKEVKDYAKENNLHAWNF